MCGAYVALLWEVDSASATYDPCVFRPLKRRIPLVKVVLRLEYDSIDLNTL